MPGWPKSAADLPWEDQRPDFAGHHPHLFSFSLLGTSGIRISLGLSIGLFPSATTGNHRLPAPPARDWSWLQFLPPMQISALSFSFGFSLVTRVLNVLNFNLTRTPPHPLYSTYILHFFCLRPLRAGEFYYAIMFYWMGVCQSWIRPWIKGVPQVIS